jgi:hypothetical protein
MRQLAPVVSIGSPFFFWLPSLTSSSSIKFIYRNTQDAFALSHSLLQKNGGRKAYGNKKIHQTPFMLMNH